MKNIIVVMSAVMLMFTSCEKYVLQQETIAYSLNLFEATKAEYEASLDKLHSLELQQELFPEAKDSLGAQIDSVFL